MKDKILQTLSFAAIAIGMLLWGAFALTQCASAAESTQTIYAFATYERLSRPIVGEHFTLVDANDGHEYAHFGKGDVATFDLPLGDHLVELRQITFTGGVYMHQTFWIHIIDTSKPAYLWIHKTTLRNLSIAFAPENMAVTMIKGRKAAAR